VLPASGARVWLRDASGEDEMLVLQSSGPPLTTILALVNRLACDPAGEPIDWPSLPAVDLAAAALLIRSSWLGDAIRTEALCPSQTCGEPIDITFGITAYLEHRRPRAARGVSQLEDGWLSLDGTDARFRIPAIADLLAGLRGDDEALLERCVRPSHPTARTMRRIDRALEALAPRADGELSGICPDCGATVELYFEPIGYVLHELRDSCSSVYADVHELALAYHWPEPSILALDRRRRGRYVAMVRGELALA
jgi:hypothetical protein